MIVLDRTEERTTVRSDKDKWHQGPYAVVVNTGAEWTIFYAAVRTDDMVAQGCFHAAGEDSGYGRRALAEDVAKSGVRSLLQHIQQGTSV